MSKKVNFYSKDANKNIPNIIVQYVYQAAVNKISQKAATVRPAGIKHLQLFVIIDSQTENEPGKEENYTHNNKCSDHSCNAFFMHKY